MQIFNILPKVEKLQEAQLSFIQERFMDRLLCSRCLEHIKKKIKIPDFMRDNKQHNKLAYYIIC